jgi:hypothetical protein
MPNFVPEKMAANKMAAGGHLGFDGNKIRHAGCEDFESTETHKIWS